MINVNRDAKMRLVKYSKDDLSYNPINNRIPKE